MRIAMPTFLVKGTPTPAPLWLAGFIATLVFAFSNIYFKKVSGIAEPLLALLGFWCVFRYGSGLARSVAFNFLWAALAIQLLSWAGSQFSHPELAEPYPKLDRLARLFLFLLLAWWLGGQTRNVFIFWTVAAAGLLISPWVLGFGHTEMLQGFKGSRIDLDIRNAQHPALLYGSLLIGLVVFLPRILKTFKPWSVLPWALVFALTVAVVVFTQTRAVWSGLVIVIIAAPVALILLNYRKVSRKSAITLVLLIVAALAALTVTISQVAPQRIFAEQSSVRLVLDGDFENLPYSSIGTRIHSWRAGLELAAQHPFIGWGGNAREYALAQVGWVPDEKAERFQHLHNSYLELLVQYGLIGLAWYLLLLGWLAKSTLSAWKKGNIPGDVALFFALFLVFWSWANLFESYLGFWTGELLINLVCAGMVTLIWKDRFRKLEAGQ